MTGELAPCEGGQNRAGEEGRGRVDPDEDAATEELMEGEEEGEKIGAGTGAEGGKGRGASTELRE